MGSYAGRIPERAGPTEWIVCHEIGHASGLGHWRDNPDTCMNDVSVGGRHLVFHDQWVIDAVTNPSPLD